VIFLAGIAFDNLNKYSISIGTYSKGYTDLTESFIKKLQEKEFSVEKFSSEESCVNAIKQSKIHTCIIFPENMKVDSDKTSEITFHVDNSKINLVWMILDTLSSKLTERSSELSMDLTSNLLNKLELSKNEVSASRPIVSNLESESKQVSDRVSQLNNEIASSKISSLKLKTSSFRDYLTEEANSLKNMVNLLEDDIDDLNVSEDEKDPLKKGIDDARLKISNLLTQTDTSQGDYSEIIATINEIESSLKSSASSIETIVSKSSSEINQIKNSFDNIYAVLEDVKIKDAATIVNPITTNIKPVIAEKSHLKFMFPALIVLVVMFISILLSTTLVMMEKHSPAYFRNFITPTREIVFILGTYLTNMILVIVQLLIIMGISLIFFKSQILSMIPITFLLLVIITSFFTFTGMLVGSIFTSEETATLASISLGSIFLFLSDVILPVESMPDFMQNIASFNPFIIAEDLIKKTILFQSKLSLIINGMLLLIGYSLVIFVIVVLIHNFSRKHRFFAIEFHKKKKEEAKK
jgi:ABC-type multidrug transport system permease subunit